jgi:hypothetical protein
MLNTRFVLNYTEDGKKKEKIFITREDAILAGKCWSDGANFTICREGEEPEHIECYNVLTTVRVGYINYKNGERIKED